ncbi:MAG TPA: BON domain-containing protein [Caulobacteraceae bacterium]|nr:BON domain-containing protein [Caulobacteraceae bacterium]
MTGESGAHHDEAPADVEEISDDITHVLGHSWFFDPQTIKVYVDGSSVRLTGTVRSERERRMAAAAAWSHEGVTQVANELVVA